MVNNKPNVQKVTYEVWDAFDNMVDADETWGLYETTFSWYPTAKGRDEALEDEKWKQESLLW